MKNPLMVCGDQGVRVMATSALWNRFVAICTYASRVVGANQHRRLMGGWTFREWHISATRRPVMSQTKQLWILVAKQLFPEDPEGHSDDAARLAEMERMQF